MDQLSALVAKLMTVFGSVFRFFGAHSRSFLDENPMVEGYLELIGWRTFLPGLATLWISYYILQWLVGFLLVCVARVVGIAVLLVLGWLFYQGGFNWVGGFLNMVMEAMGTMRTV